MRELLDECVPKKLRRDLSAHKAHPVTEMGWAGTKNGPLLRQAAAEFHVLLTVDQGIEFQHSLAGVDLAVIIMAAASNDIDDLRQTHTPSLGGARIDHHGQVVVVKA